MRVVVVMKQCRSIGAIVPPKPHLYWGKAPALKSFTTPSLPPTDGEHIQAAVKRGLLPPVLPTSYTPPPVPTPLLQLQRAARGPSPTLKRLNTPRAGEYDVSPISQSSGAQQAPAGSMQSPRPQATPGEGEADAHQGAELGVQVVPRRTSVTPRSVFDFMEFQTMLTGEHRVTPVRTQATLGFGICADGQSRPWCQDWVPVSPPSHTSPPPSHRAPLYTALTWPTLEIFIQASSFNPATPGPSCAGKRLQEEADGSCKRARTDDPDAWMQEDALAMLDLQ